jgi:hypothetical protein
MTTSSILVRFSQIGSMWTYDSTDHMMVNIDVIVALASKVYQSRIYRVRLFTRCIVWKELSSITFSLESES